MTRHSAIYEGVVHHVRFTPKRHEFRFRMFMVYLDLSELDQVFRGSWTWSTRRLALARFKRSDYLGPAEVPLDQAVRDRVERETGARPGGPIRMLTHLRYFGYVFNPVTFYYCFDERGETVETVVAEITNTPWKERRAYILPASAVGAIEDEHAGFRFDKDFHVSPFMPMDLSYDWLFTRPSESLAVRMNLDEAPGRTFEARLFLRRREITPARLRRTLLEFPLMTMRVIARIHWEALRLWLKRCPVHSHPASLAGRSEA